MTGETSPVPLLGEELPLFLALSLSPLFFVAAALPEVMTDETNAWLKSKFEDPKGTRQFTLELRIEFNFPLLIFYDKFVFGMTLHNQLHV